MSFLSSVGTFFSSDLGQSLTGTAIKTATSILQGNGSNTGTTPGTLPLTGSGSVSVGGTTIGVGNQQTPAWLYPVLGVAGLFLLIFAFMSKK
jgi:hypothetical protein